MPYSEEELRVILTKKYEVCYIEADKKFRSNSADTVVQPATVSAAMKKDLLNQFLLVMSNSLPSLVQLTRHPCELWTAIQAVWHHHYGVAIDDFLRDCFRMNKILESTSNLKSAVLATISLPHFCINVSSQVFSKRNDSEKLALSSSIMEV